MRPRILLLPAALLAALAFVAPIEAEASPHGRRHGHAVHGRAVHGRAVHRRAVHGRQLHAHRGGAFVGGAVSFPIRQRGGYYREVIEVVGGFYETRTREVEVPGRRIGWDRHGHPVFAGSRVVLETYEAWVPRRRVIRQVWVPARPLGVITIGGRVRVR